MTKLKTKGRPLETGGESLDEARVICAGCFWELVRKSEENSARKKSRKMAGVRKGVGRKPSEGSKYRRSDLPSWLMDRSEENQ